jgi:hypothetical protein
MSSTADQPVTIDYRGRLTDKEGEAQPGDPQEDQLISIAPWIPALRWSCIGLPGGQALPKLPADDN